MEKSSVSKQGEDSSKSDCSDCSIGKTAGVAAKIPTDFGFGEVEAMASRSHTSDLLLDLTQQTR